MGKKAVPQAKPGAMKQPGRERRRGAVEVLALSALRPSPEVLSSCRRTKTCPKKRPVEGHSCWFTPVAVVCHVPMRRVCLERPCRRQQGEWQSRGRKRTTRPLAGVHAGRGFAAASKAARRLGEPGVHAGLLEPRVRRAGHSAVSEACTGVEDA